MEESWIKLLERNLLKYPGGLPKLISRRIYHGILEIFGGSPGEIHETIPEEIQGDSSKESPEEVLK